MSILVSTRFLTSIIQPLARGGASLRSSTGSNPVRTQFFNLMNFTPSIPVPAEYAASSSLGLSRGLIFPYISLQGLIDQAIIYIKRTWQPSLVKRKRKHGFLERQKSVGGRKILKRRMKKNRKRLGC